MVAEMAESKVALTVALTDVHLVEKMVACWVAEMVD